MPIYEYRCTECDHRLEKLQRMADDPLKDCPECDKPALKKLVSAATFKLKGSGWYETDFKGKDKPSAESNGTESNSSESSSSESKGSESSSSESNSSKATKSSDAPVKDSKSDKPSTKTAKDNTKKGGSEKPKSSTTTGKK